MATDRKKGHFTFRTAAVLLMASAAWELLSITSEVPLFGEIRGGISAGFGDEPADQRVAVGMRPRRSEADDGIAGAHLRAVDDAVLLHDADAEARKVIIRPVVHAGHLCRLAADQCAARLPASLGDARNDTLGDL